MARPSRILLIGNTGRVDCLAAAFSKSAHPNEIYALAEVLNPGLVEKCVRVEVGAIDDVTLVEKYADDVKPDFVFIGPEQPLAAGVVDAMQSRGIPSVAPTKNAARIETSKSFARQLIQLHAPRYNPIYRHFSNTDGLEEYMSQLGQFVIKPDGLTGGKGVKVFGVHFHTVNDGLEYCAELLAQPAAGILIEEKLDGEEFSLQSFCDGLHIAHSPPVQDHKRAFEGDTGPNTGGVGSYSCADHCLPFLSPELVREAASINKLVFKAIKNELGESYRGILYGNFIATAQGLKVIEYNARFGDPEVMNVLAIMKNDFLDVCHAMLNGTLDKMTIEFEAKSTVCKWVVPQGYPTDPIRGVEIDANSIARSTEKLRTYFGAIDFSSGTYRLAGSRAIAFLGVADTIMEAEGIAERAASGVKGPVYHRKDIGTEALIQQRVRHMQEILASTPRGHQKYA
jgi:phosphoribosylamine--glycine ligase